MSSLSDHTSPQPVAATYVPPTSHALHLANEIGLTLDGCEDATPSDLKHPAYNLWQVVQAHLKDAHDALRVLQGEVTPAHPDWDIMPADVQEAAATLYPTPPPNAIRGSSTLSSTSPSVVG